MGATEFTANHPLAVKLWSKSLAVEAEKKAFFRKFTGTGLDNIIVVKTELKKAAGDKITFGLRMNLSGYGIEGDNKIEDTDAEEALNFFADAVSIDQLRKGTKSKGKMSEQRVPYSIREQGRNALSTWWAELYDQMQMVYLAGARGINADFILKTNFASFAGNAVEAPDASHILYGGDATGKADLADTDKISLNLVERLVAKAETTDPMMQPIMIDGEKKFVLLMHTFQAYDLRTSTTDNDWVNIQKMAGERGKGNLLYKNSLGEYADVILHKHRNVIRFSDYGTDGTGNAARALFLGAQAGVMAWGGDGAENRYTWHEEYDDRGNALAITAGSIFGVKKTRFNSKDYSVVACDTAVSVPV